MDFKCPYQREGRILWRFDLIYDASRLLITSVECESANSKVVLGTIRAKRYGKPLYGLTDNGAVFVSLRVEVSAFHRWCIEKEDVPDVMLSCPTSSVIPHTGPEV